MTHLPGKITITQEEIAEVAPHMVPPVSPAALTILPLASRPRKRHSKVVLAVLTPIPFVNAWAWFAHARSRAGTGRRLCLGAAILAGMISLALAAGAGLYLVMPRKDWIATIQERAENGVVIVACQAGDGPKAEGRMGTGFVVSRGRGGALLLTNRHVVGLWAEPACLEAAQAVRCRVALRSREILEARVVGWHRSPEVDLALLLVEGSDLRPLGPVAQFSEARMGDDVLAIGHPEGLWFSFCRGTVENKHDGRFLQTSATINPGNSGGPLLDKKCRVVAVNTLVFQPEVGAAHALSIRADYLLEPDEWICSPQARELLKAVAKD